MASLGGRQGSYHYAVCVIILLLAIAFAGYRYSVRTLTPPRARNLLSIPAERLDFGEHFATKDLRCSVPIKNIGLASLHVTDVELSCGCTQVSPAEFTLAPGQTQVLEFTVDLSGPSNSLGGSRPFSVSFAPILENNLVMKDSWLLTGRVKPAFSVGIAQLNYDGGARLVAGGSHAPAVVPLQRFISDVELSIECPKDLGRAELRDDEIVFRPSPSLLPGTYTGELKVFGSIKEEVLSPVVVPIYLYVTGIAEAMPRIVDFGLLPAETTASCRVLLTSPTGKPFRVIADIGQDEMLDISTENDTPSAAHWITLRLNPPLVGAADLTARLGMRDENETQILELPVRYRVRSKR